MQCWPRWATWLWWVSSLLSFWPLSTFWSTKRFPGLFLWTINSHYTLPSVAPTTVIKSTATQNIGEILTKPIILKEFWHQKYISLDIFYPLISSFPVFSVSLKIPSMNQTHNRMTSRHRREKVRQLFMLRVKRKNYILWMMIWLRKGFCRNTSN